MRSAESWIGVRGLRISCARRRATSPQAAWRCACSSCVTSSNTSTRPCAPASPGNAVQATTSSRRPLSARSVNCSRHSVSPASTWRCSISCSSARSGCPAATSASGRPALPAKSTPRMLPAAWLATRTRRSGSSEMTPLVRRARITASAARSASTAARLRSVSSRARASFLVMSLNEVTRKPISSCDARSRRVSKSPFATARVPAMRSCTGRTRRSEKYSAPYTAASSAISSTSESVSTNVAFSGSRR